MFHGTGDPAPIMSPLDRTSLQHRLVANATIASEELTSPSDLAEPAVQPALRDVSRTAGRDTGAVAKTDQGHRQRPEQINE